MEDGSREAGLATTGEQPRLASPFELPRLVSPCEPPGTGGNPPDAEGTGRRHPRRIDGALWSPIGVKHTLASFMRYHALMLSARYVGRRDEWTTVVAVSPDLRRHIGAHF